MPGGQSALDLNPVALDSPAHTSMLLRKMVDHTFTATTRQCFRPRRTYEEAGLIIYRNRLRVVARAPYTGTEVVLSVHCDGLSASFAYGENEADLHPLGGTQSLACLTEDCTNHFNGPGVGVYAGSNGQPSRNRALYEWFTYKGEKEAATPDTMP